jgi:hypothetical protein
VDLADDNALVEFLPKEKPPIAMRYLASINGSGSFLAKLLLVIFSKTAVALTAWQMY